MDPWMAFHSAAMDAVSLLWYEFAKECIESAALAPLGQYPNAAARLAQSLATSPDYVPRKLGAMLAGWIDYPKHAGLLSQMLKHEREVFRDDPLSANSVGEDIMFAATRWTESVHPEIRQAGIDVLAGMIKDAIEGTPWNTANWAIANLHRATEGQHKIFRDLANATDAQMKGQKFLQKAVTALKQNDKQTLGRLVTTPSETLFLSPTDPNYSEVSFLWTAAAAAEAALT
jgi:hypothetical protein